MNADGPEDVAVRFLEAFNRADLTGMRGVLDDDLVGFVTGPDGAEFEVTGADAYLSAIEAMDLPSAEFSVTLTQAPVLADPDRVLMMVEVRARRGDRALHNYAAHLVRVAGGRIIELRMVEAKPAESDAFWA